MIYLLPDSTGKVLFVVHVAKHNPPPNQITLKSSSSLQWQFCYSYPAEDMLSAKQKQLKSRSNTDVDTIQQFTQLMETVTFAVHRNSTIS